MSIDQFPDRPLVSIIIPHYNQNQALRLCLESIERQTYDFDRLDVIIVDNNSVTDPSDLRAEFPQFLFLKEEKRGAAHARNKGMKAARGGVFAFIDADCVADPRWIENGISALSDADLSGGNVEVSVENNRCLTPVEAFERIFAFRQESYIKRKHFAVTANLLVNRAVAESIGQFRNQVAEDLDWCRRARALGFRLVFNGKSSISHPARKSWDELTRKWGRLVAERWYGFGGQGFARRFMWVSLAMATAISVVPHFFVILLTDRVIRIEDKLGAVGVLARIRLWRARKMLAML